MKIFTELEFPYYLGLDQDFKYWLLEILFLFNCIYKVIILKELSHCSSEEIILF